MTLPWRCKDSLLFSAVKILDLMQFSSKKIKEVLNLGYESIFKELVTSTCAGSARNLYYTHSLLVSDRSRTQSIFNSWFILIIDGNNAALSIADGRCLRPWQDLSCPPQGNIASAFLSRSSLQRCVCVAKSVRADSSIARICREEP